MDHHPDTPRNRGDKDAPHISPVTPNEDVRTVAINQIAWGAVFAGVAVALVTQLLLNMLGLGIGLATLDPGTSDNPSASGFSIGAAIWWTLSGIIASFAGGWIAGRLAGKPKESTAGWHGITTWAETTLVIVYLLSSAVSSVIGGALGTLGNAAGGIARTTAGAAATVAPAVANNDAAMAGLEQQVRSAASGTDPGAIRDAAVAAVRVMVSGDKQEAAQAREQAAQALARANNIPLPQARQQVATYERQYSARATQAKETATRAADTASTAASSAALLSAIALLLGAVAAWFGGRRGAVHPTVTGLRSM